MSALTVNAARRARPATLPRVLAAGAVGLVFFFGGGQAGAQQASVEFTVSGNSTIRSWTCQVPAATQASFGSSTALPGLDRGVESATLTVQLQDFVCPEEEMREHLLEAMRAAEFPEITFRLDGYEASEGGVVATGSLTILDSTQSVSFPVSLTPEGSGVRLEGELPLDMTTYGVEPPVVFLGLLRVRPRIRIQFSGVVTA